MATVKEIILLAAGAGVSVQAQVSFLYPTTLQVEGNITSIVGGDFNNDGLGDFAVSFGAPVVAVFLSKGDGTFTRQDLAVPSGGVLAAAADIAGNHKLGLIGTTFSILGNGDGTFQPATPSGALGAVAVADFNGDGAPDILSRANDMVRGMGFQIQFGRGDGTFGPPVRAGDFPDPHNYSNYAYVAVGDLSGDGLPEILWSSQVNAGPDVWLNNGDGSFRYLDYPTAPVAGGGLNKYLAVGDVNEDGRNDVVETDGPSVYIFTGNGTGMLRAAGNYLSKPPGFTSSVGEGAGQVVLADFDGDGKVDISTTYYVLPGNGDGTFRPGVGFGQVNPFPSAGTRSSIVAQDVNGDGKPDLVVIGPGQNMVSVLINCSGTRVASAPAYLALPNGDIVQSQFQSPAPASGRNLAPGALAVLFGEGLSATTATANMPLPTTIGNASVELVDFAGTRFLAPLLYVSPTQINFQVPDNAATGLAMVNVLGTGLPRGAHSTLILSDAAGIFTVDGSGKGAPVASAVLAGVDGTQTDTIANPLTIPAKGQVYLSLYGTGFRHSSSADCVVGKQYVKPSYFGPQGQSSLLDQINIPIPATTPKGSTEISCQFSNSSTNAVTISIQ